MLVATALMAVVLVTVATFSPAAMAETSDGMIVTVAMAGMSVMVLKVVIVVKVVTLLSVVVLVGYVNLPPSVTGAREETY